MNKNIKNTLFIASAIAVMVMIAVFIGFASGSFTGVTADSDDPSSENSEAINETYTHIKSLDISVNARNVKVTRGSSFKVESQDPGETFKLENRDGNIMITEQESSGKFITLFGYVSYDQTYEDLNITFPEGTSLRDVFVDVNSGQVDISDVQADRFVIDNDEQGDINISNVTAGSIAASSDSGDIDMKNVKISKLQLNTDTGNIITDKIEAEEVKGRLNSGEIKLGGNVEGPVDISNEQGNIDLFLVGDEPSYSYEIESEQGDISINGLNHGTNYLKENGKKPMIELNASNGFVNIGFV